MVILFTYEGRVNYREIVVDLVDLNTADWLAIISSLQMASGGTGWENENDC